MIATEIITNFAAACQPKAISIIPTWYKYLDSETLGGKCSPIFNIPNDAIPVLLAVFEMVLFIGGIAAVVFIIYGGFQYIISQGEPDRTKAALGTLLNALIGLAITLSAIAIVNLIGRNL